MGIVSTLDLDPEMGDVDFIEDLERVFGITLTQDDVARWLTLGDVRTTLAGLLSEGEHAEGACSTAMVFYRVRRALYPEVLDRSLTPATELRALSRKNPNRLLHQLESKTGLRMPLIVGTRMSAFGTLLFLLSILAGILATKEASWPIAAVAALSIGAAVLLFRADPGEFPNGLNTIGDLVRRVSALNPVPLRREGARFRVADDWTTIAAIASEHGGMSPESIGPDTYLFRSTFEKSVNGG